MHVIWLTWCLWGGLGIDSHVRAAHGTVRQGQGHRHLPLTVYKSRWDQRCPKHDENPSHRPKDLELQVIAAACSPPQKLPSPKLSRLTLAVTKSAVIRSAQNLDPRKLTCFQPQSTLSSPSTSRPAAQLSTSVYLSIEIQRPTTLLRGESSQWDGKRLKTEWCARLMT